MPAKKKIITNKKYKFSTGFKQDTDTHNIIFKMSRIKSKIIQYRRTRKISMIHQGKGNKWKPTWDDSDITSIRPIISSNSYNHVPKSRVNIIEIYRRIGSLNRETEAIKMNPIKILELSNTTTKIKNSLDVFNSKMEMAKKSMNLKDWSIQIMQSEQQRNKTLEGIIW